MKVEFATILVAASFGMTHCKSNGGQPLSPRGVNVETLTVTSPDFAPGGPIPVDFTCDGLDRSPALTLSAPPSATRSFAIVMDDPDAPGGTFTHWLVYNLRPETLAIGEGIDPAAAGGASGINDFKRLGYSGPCPPKYEEHHYRFRVMALDAILRLDGSSSREAIEAAMNGHVVGQGSLVAVYSH